MKITVPALTYKNLYNAQLLFYKHTRIKWLHRLMGVGFGFVMFFLSLKGHLPWYFVVFTFAYGVAFCFYEIILLPLITLYRFKKLKTAHVQSEVELTDNGISVHSARGNGDSPWTTFYGYLHDDKMLLLFINYQMFIIFARSDYSDEMWQELLSMVKTHLKPAR